MTVIEVHFAALKNDRRIAQWTPCLGGFVFGVLLLLSTSAQGQLKDEVRTLHERHFESKIRPVLVAKCIQCHGAEKQEGGLRLDSAQAMLAGGDSGPAITIDDADSSVLLEAIRYESYEMPPTGQLPDSTIQDFEKWLADGSYWPEQSATLRHETGVITDADREWWAFQELTNVHPPVTEGDQWSENAIDQFIYRKLSEEELEPAPRASDITLVRRLYFDLIGLPPTQEEIESYLADTSPDAWEKLVDRLLVDERYGEHWARFWLDLVRYAESDGWNQDAYRPLIYRYRDYVVRSFNQDKPYTDFVREQLAGDETGADNADHLTATGFLRLGIYEYNQRDARNHWNDIMNEMTDVVGDVFLGLSMACARCHDHKFDPIPQTDYFKLRAYLEPISWRDDLVAATREEKVEHEKQMRVWESATTGIRAEIDALLELYHKKKWESTVDKFPVDIQACFHMPVAERTSWQNQMAYLVSRQFLEEAGGPLKNISKEDKAKHEALKEKLAEFDHLKPEPLPTVMAATDFSGIASPTLIPGKPTHTPVKAGSLEVLDFQAASPSPERLERESVEVSSGRRAALAEWIASSDNPLTSRVITNRIWQRHFGLGIVETCSDFGTQGSVPSHPELLDWLTRRFVDEGWSMKRLHKMILTSATWRQDSQHPKAASQQLVDPGEELFWRAPVRRLQAEQIRDAMLAASGELEHRVGGPSTDESSMRRSLYMKSFRNKNDSFLHGFDIANGLKSVSTRDRTTTPTQALLLINGKFALERAKKLASLLTKQTDDPVEQVELSFVRTWSRKPTTEELEQALNFVGYITGEEADNLNRDRLIDLCHILLNSSRFLYVR
ncbi:MAG: PSD1 and planctomycete cytochrome C domain-containing protein [Pirellulaceae bacterium]